MASRISKLVTFTVPPAMVEEMDLIAKEERRSKSELFREMFRLYRLFREQKRREDEERLGQIVQRALADAPSGAENESELLLSLGALQSYGAERARAAGIINEDQLDHLLYASRPKQRTP